VHEGLLIESGDQCLKNPEREGFVGSFSIGRSALCLDVNRCMALCDQTNDCVAVEMSQAVNRCVLKGSPCLSSEFLADDSRTNLIVLVRSHRVSTTSVASGDTSYKVSAISDRPRNSGSEVMLSAAKLVANASAAQPGIAKRSSATTSKQASRSIKKSQYEERQKESLKTNQDKAEAARLEHLVSLMSFDVVDLPRDVHQRFAFSGSVLSGCTLYLVPFNADAVGIFDTATQKFRSVKIPDLGTQQWKYSSGAMHKGVAYFVPYAADNIGVFNTQDDTFRTIDISAASSGNNKYSSMLFSEGVVYFVPSSANNVGIFMPGLEHFRTVQLPHSTSTHWKYRGGVVVDRHCYFAPYNADDVGILDADSLSFRSVDISSIISKDMKFSGAFRQNGIVYFVPFNADEVGTLDVSTDHFRLLDISKSITRDFKYWGAVQDHDLAFFVPDNADTIGVLHPASKSFASIDISGKVSMDLKFSTGVLVNEKIYFVPRNADSIGILQVGRSDPQACVTSSTAANRQGLRSASRPANQSSAVVAPPAVASERGKGHGPSVRRSLLKTATTLLGLAWGLVSDTLLACVVLAGAVACAELSRRRWSSTLDIQPFLSVTIAVLVSALFFSVLRNTLELWAATASFLGRADAVLGRLPRTVRRAGGFFAAGVS